MTTTTYTTRPAVYAGTYGMYNSGSLYGKWFYFDEYESREEMLSIIYEYLKEEDDDPEIMFQDFEGFPRELYSECSLSEELFDFCDYIRENPGIEDAVTAYVKCFNEWNESDFEDRYLGYFSDYYDLAMHFVDNGCIDIPSELERYFDYDSYGRDIAYDFAEYDGHYFYY